MGILSPIGAISPALGRTRRLLFQPFSWPIFLKLCAVAVFTEGLFSNFRARAGSHAPAPPGGMYSNIPEEWIALLVLVASAVIVIVLALLYLSTRLRFALFDCLIHQTTKIRPGWHLYRRPAFRFFLLSIAVGCAYLALAIIVLYQFLSGVFQILHAHQGSQIPPNQVFALFVPLIPIVVGLILLAILIDLVLRDFMLPHMALENASAAEAWEEVWDRMSSEPGPFLLYAFLRLLLPFAVIVGLFIILALPTILVFAGPALLMKALHEAIAVASPAAAMVFHVLQGMIWAIMAALGVLIAIAFGGPLCIAIRNYALMFYGGRYRLLGDILSPPPPA